MDSVYVDTGLLCRVAPFRNLRINAYVQLPEAYRSLSRLSSAPDAKAFPSYSLQLDLRQRRLRIVRISPAGKCLLASPRLKGSFCLVT